jgi:hypothetical protein
MIAQGEGSRKMKETAPVEKDRSGVSNKFHTLCILFPISRKNISPARGLGWWSDQVVETQGDRECGLEGLVYRNMVWNLLLIG